MKKKQLVKISLLLILLSSQSQALECPDKKKAPLCPRNGITLLDETYPTQSFVISNDSQIRSKEGKETTQNFINKIIKSYDYEDVPQIILTIKSPKEFDLFKEATKKKLIENKVSPDKINKILGQFSHVPGQNYTWQQDWFESFVDLKTGTPVIKQIDSYISVELNAGQLLTKSGETCNIKQGNHLKDEASFYNGVEKNAYKSTGAGEMGGNIEGAPGGFCMIGNNLGKSMALQICNDKSNIIQLNTSWLRVGHVDEIFKIIPTQFMDGRPSECEFSLMSASPKKALELMKNPKLGQLPFTEFNHTDFDPKEARESRSRIDKSGNFKKCMYIVESLKNRTNSKKILPPVRSVLIKLLLPQEVYADEASMNKFLDLILDNPKEMAAFSRSCSQNIDKVSNIELQVVMQADSNFVKLNTAIDQSLEKDRLLIKKKILSRLPQCTKWYNDLEVPNLFYGDSPVELIDGKLELPLNGEIASFLPNPTNSVLMNKTVTFPDTGNRLFNNYLSEEMVKRKMKADFILTWDYAHVASGNIHCASHSITHCRPNDDIK